MKRSRQASHLLPSGGETGSHRVGLFMPPEGIPVAGLERAGAARAKRPRDLPERRFDALLWNAVDRPYPIADWFTEDFHLHDPNLPDWPTGHAGAAKMMDQFRALGGPIHFEAVEIIEDGDRAAVRWSLSATQDGQSLSSSIMAMYRFEGGRIAEDWGISVNGLSYGT
jgi:predicted SnoaL-like aldol condensation-catalyzing enzyme